MTNQFIYGRGIFFQNYLIGRNDFLAPPSNFTVINALT